MPAAKRPRRAVTEGWEQPRLFVTAPAREAYELPRSIVLFGRTPAERAVETGVAERTLRRLAVTAGGWQPSAALRAGRGQATQEG